MARSPAAQHFIQERGSDAVMPESFYVQALYAYSGVDTSSLSFRQGEIIEVLSTLPSGWWDGVLCEQKIRGWFPSNYVQRISDEEAGWAKEEMQGWWEGAGETEEDDEDPEQDESSPIGNTSTSNSSGQPSPVLQSSPSRHRTTDSTASAISRTDTQDEEDYWVPKVTYSGQVFYYNTRTAETSRDMPMDGQGDGVVISPDEFAAEQVEATSILPMSNGGLGPAVELRRMSVYSDDSVLDADFGEGRTTNRRSFGPPQRESSSTFPTLQTNASTGELFDPPLPPFLIELELGVSESLQALISAVGIGGLRLLEKDSELHAASDRETLVVLMDSVVDAISILLHSAGALDSSVDMPFSTPNEISGPFPRPLSLPPFTLIELRPFTRRVTSTLSKLVLSIRAVWGLLETIARDQQVEQHNPIDHPTAEEDALFHKENETKKYDWGLVKESRLAVEAKLRSEVLSGVRDVQAHVLSFLGEFERHLAALTMEDGATFDRTTLRMPNATLGALTMNAAALSSPGGGYGGNWRGNGFVTLPSSHTETNLESLMGAAAIGGGSQRAGLSYAYPMTPLSGATAKSLVAESAELLDDADALRSAVNSLSSSSSPITASTSTHSRSVSASSLSSSFTRSRPLSSSSYRRTDSTQYLDLASRLIGRISMLLAQVEDTDVAVSVDLELKKLSDVDGAKVHSPEYIKSVQEVRPLLEELDVAKQQLFDIAPALLSAVQDSFMAYSLTSRSSESPISGANPLLTSPLAFYSPPTRSDNGTQSILDVLSGLKSAVDLLCRTFTALGEIADVQALTSPELRQSSSAPRPIKPSHDHDVSSTTIVQSTTSQPSSSASSRQSLGRAFDEEFPSPNQVRPGNRASTDSDFFFPTAQSQSNLVAASSTSPPTTPTSSPNKSRSSKTSAMFSAIGGGWDRRESNATTASGMSDGMPYRKELPFRVDENGQFITSFSFERILIAWAYSFAYSITFQRQAREAAGNG